MSYPAIAIIGLTLVVGMTGSSVLQAAPNDDESTSRYSFHKVEGGTLRMDRESGTAALCDKKGPAWICSDLKQLQQAKDQQSALLNEISRLATLNEQQSEEMQKLRQQVASLSDRLGKLEAAKPDGAKGDAANDAMSEKATPKPDAPKAPEKRESPLPEQDEDSAHFDEFLERSERLFRHFFGLVKEFKRDLEDERA